MTVGIYINVVDEKIGGGFSYVQQVVQHFDSLDSHEFYFLVNKGQAQNVLQGISTSKIKEFDPELYEQEVETDPHYKSLTQKQSLIESINYRLKLGVGKKRISKLIEKRRKARYDVLDKSFTQFCLDLKIDCLYYPQPEVCRTTGIPYYATVWDCGHFTRPQFSEITGDGEFDRRHNALRHILPQAHKVVRESEDGANELKEFYNVPREDVVVVPQFPSQVIFEDPSHPAFEHSLQELGVEKGKFIFYPAQFWAHKNHERLLSAFKVVKEEIPKMKLILTGSDQGNFTQVMKRIDELKLGDDVINLGFVDLKQLRWLYEQAYCLIYPSMLGPTNMPIVEGIALSCPVVCTNHKGHMEQGSDAALYFDAENTKEMAEAILKVKDGDNRSQMISKGKRHYESYSKLQVAFRSLENSFDEFEKTNLK